MSERTLTGLSYTELQQTIVDLEAEKHLVQLGIRDLLKDIALEVRTIRRLLERAPGR